MSERFGDTKRDRDALDRWITRDRPDDEVVGDPVDEIEGPASTVADPPGGGLISGAPIMIPCEGVGGDGHTMYPGLRMCAMCGRYFANVRSIPEHDRDDILARIDRGDFG